MNTSLNVNRQEAAYYLFLGSILLFGIFFLAGTLWYAMPTERILIGMLDQFPPKSDPYELPSEVGKLFVVNAGTEVVVFVPEITLYSRKCRVEWKSDRRLFIEPCWGAKFTLDGIWCDGPAFQNLDQYQVRVDGNQIKINLSKRLQGDLTALGKASIAPVKAEGGVRPPGCPK